MPQLTHRTFLSRRVALAGGILAAFWRRGIAGSRAMAIIIPIIPAFPSLA